jgi:hypothetical protein
MEWTVKIEKETKQRILVKFDPLNGRVVAYGQYSTHGEWVNFSSAECPIANIGLEELQKLLTEVLDDLRIKIEKFDDLNKSFKLIGSISIEEPEKEDKESQGGGLMM